MKNKLFNTPFEAGLRSLLVLSVFASDSATIDRIAAYDFISIYGKDFGISEFNLHGNNVFNFSEFPAKRSLITDGVKQEVLDGMANVSRTSSGFKYRLSKSGFAFVESLNTSYSEQYLDTLRKVDRTYRGLSDIELMNVINRKALTALKR